MMLTIRAAQQGVMIQTRQNLKESSMKWETPTAVDFRFGMEITMYIANR